MPSLANPLLRGMAHGAPLQPAPPPPVCPCAQVYAFTPVGRINSVVSATSAGGTTLGPLSRALSSAGRNPMPSLGGAGPAALPAPSATSERGGGSSALALGPMASALPAGSVGAAGAAHSASGGSVLRAFASWLWSAVILDERRAGVTYDVDAGAFTTAAAMNGYPDPHGSALAAATGVRELGLLFEVFGPGAAADLGRGCSALVQSCLEQLQVGSGGAGAGRVGSVCGCRVCGLKDYHIVAKLGLRPSQSTKMLVFGVPGCAQPSTSRLSPHPRLLLGRAGGALRPAGRAAGRRPLAPGRPRRRRAASPAPAADSGGGHHCERQRQQPGGGV